MKKSPDVLVFMQLVSRAISILYWRLFTLFTINSPADYLLLFFFLYVRKWRNKLQCPTAQVFSFAIIVVLKRQEHHTRETGMSGFLTITTIINIQLVCLPNRGGSGY